ncbi:MAG: ATPase, T2SS/T4P/T4SS family [Planctomycetota bacterium]|jgi:type II secretory ATPase GspE/PulE/Tfp pilus assembly ATPase PilB-like protein
MLNLVGKRNTEPMRIETLPHRIGRERGCDSIIRDSSVSRRHAEFFLQDDQLYLQDLLSSNGTKLNGARLEGPHAVSHGDVVQFGDVKYKALFDNVPGRKRKRRSGTTKPAPERDSQRPQQSDSDEEASRETYRGPAVDPGAKPPLPVQSDALRRSPRASDSNPETDVLEHPGGTARVGQLPLYLVICFGAALTVGCLGLLADWMGNRTLDSTASVHDSDSNGGAQTRGLALNLSESAQLVKVLRAVHSSGLDLKDSGQIEEIARRSTDLDDEGVGRILTTVRMMAVRDLLAEGDLDLVSAVPQIAGNESRDDKSQQTDVDRGSVDAIETSERLNPEETEALLGSFRGPGFYLNPFGLGLMIVGLIVWLYGFDRVTREIRRVEYGANAWIPVLLTAGPLSLLVAFLAPHLSIAVFLQTLVVSVPFAFYGWFRESVVGSGALSQNLFSGKLDEADQSEPADQVRLVAHGTDAAPVSSKVESSPGYRTARGILALAAEQRATDVHIEPDGSLSQVRFRVDGILYDREQLEANLVRAVNNVYKILGGMDIAERRRPQDGSFRTQVGDREYDIRLATQGVSNGEKISLRLLDQSAEMANLSSLGLSRHLQGDLRDLMYRPEGMLIVAGPTGAGKSTTLRAILSELDPSEKNIITIEDPVEYRLSRINQIEINQRAGQTFATSLRSVLRQDPDVILVGEIRDEETGRIACQAANTGHLLLSTLHANDAFTVIPRLEELGIERATAVAPMNAILGQRLLRRLCAECREVYIPAVDELRGLKLPGNSDDSVRLLHRPGNSSGCQSCGGLGYRGRTGAFELLKLSKELKDQLMTGAAGDLESMAMKQGFQPLLDYGMNQAVKGATSLQELRRVLG